MPSRSNALLTGTGLTWDRNRVLLPFAIVGILPPTPPPRSSVGKGRAPREVHASRVQNATEFPHDMRRPPPEPCPRYPATCAKTPSRARRNRRATTRLHGRSSGGAPGRPPDRGDSGRVAPAGALRPRISPSI